MKINELSSDGLKRSYQVVIAATDFDGRVKTELEGLKSTVNLKGFRPGKAPISLLEKQYGDKVRGQVLQSMVNEGADKVIKDNNLTPATQPMVDIVKFETGQDVEVKVEMEILPAITVPDLSTIKLEKLEAPADDAAVKKIMDGLLGQQKQYEDAAKTAQEGGVGLIVYFRKEGRALGEVTKFLVYNARKRQEGGDSAANYFYRTECVAGVEDARFQEFMPDVLHYFGVKKIHNMHSMSNMKYDAITKSGIEVVNRLSIPDRLIPDDAKVEMEDKKAAGYFTESEKEVKDDKGLKKVQGRKFEE